MDNNIKTKEQSVQPDIPSPVPPRKVKAVKIDFATGVITLQLDNDETRQIDTPAGNSGTPE